jgi:hypothetical protein
MAVLNQQERQARSRTEQAAAEKRQAETELAGKQSELQKVKGELKTEKFKSSAAEAGTKFANTVGSLLGSSKIERQQQEIDNLKAENYTLTMQVSNRDTQIRNLHRDHRSEIERLTQSHDRDMAAKQKELARIERRQNGFGFTLTINGTPILQWFKQQFDKLKQATRPQQSRGRSV